MKINFDGGYNTVCTVYRQSSNWGSIIGHENSNHIPFFYNVQAGTSTLDELALNSKTIKQIIKTGTTDQYAQYNLNISMATVVGLFVRSPARGIAVRNNLSNNIIKVYAINDANVTNETLRQCVSESVEVVVLYIEG